MARPFRIEQPDACYDVMNCGRRGEQIFLAQRDTNTFLDLVKESVELWNLRIAAKCRTITMS